MATPSGNSDDNAHNGFKTNPPFLIKEYSYSNWKYDLSIGETFTLLEMEKQGIAVRTISVKNLSSVNDVKSKLRNFITLSQR